MTTVLKSRRTGQDLREHPAVQPVKQPTPAQTRELVIQIVKFKRNKYDRGSKKIVVNGVEWGEFHAESHGMHGPSYHARDLHGPVMVPRNDRFRGRAGRETVEASFRARSAKKVFYDNIGKPESQRIEAQSTEDQLREHVRELIAAGHLRHPEIRDAEVAEAQRKQEESREKFERETKENWEARIDVVLAAHEFREPTRGRAMFNVEKLRKAISDAMKWAQAQ